MLISFCVQNFFFSEGLISLPDGDGDDGGAGLLFYCNIKGCCNMKLKHNIVFAGLRNQRSKRFTAGHEELGSAHIKHLEMDGISKFHSRHIVN